MRYLKIYFLLFICVLSVSCSTYTEKHLVKLPYEQVSIDLNTTLEIIDSRPENEKKIKLIEWSGIYNVEDKRFFNSKIGYLKHRLLDSGLDFSDQIVVRSFKHILDIRQAGKLGSAANLSAVGAIIGVPIGTTSTRDGYDSVTCSIVLDINGKSYRAASQAFFPAQIATFHHYERPEIRRATVDTTKKAVDQLINEFLSNS